MLKAYKKHSVHSDEVKKNEYLKDRYNKLDAKFRELEELREEDNKQTLETQAEWIQFSNSLIIMSRRLLDTMSSLKENQRVSDRFINGSKEEMLKLEEVLKEKEENYNTLKQGKLKESKLIKKIKNKAEIIPELPVINPSPDLVPIDPLYLSLIDYTKLKHCLLTSEDHLKICAILQSLTWRIINRRNQVDRLVIITEYVKNDLLGFKEKGLIFKKLLNHSKQK